MSEQPTLETLSDGLSSPFWAWFSDYVTREWGPAGLRYQQAVREASQSPQAVVELQKVLHAQEAIYALMRHPAEKLNSLRDQKRSEIRIQHGLSRRGPGL